MPELSAPFEAGSSSPSLVVQVTKYPIDWDTSREFEGVTGERLKCLGDRVLRGAWFLNPRFTVYSHTPSAAFFRAAFRARTQWLRTLRQTLGNPGLRQETQKARERGRRVVYREALRASPDRVRVDRLPQGQMVEAILTGRLYQQSFSSGLMIIDGHTVPPRTWRALANRAFLPDRPTITRRHIDLASLKATHDLEPLERIARQALQDHLDEHPGQVVMVTPDATVSAPSATAEFFDKADEIRATWGHLLARTLGPGLLRRLRKAADPATLTLAIDGTLIEGGRVYFPGLWPNQTPRPKDLKRAPFQSPTAPVSFLGLTVIKDDTDLGIKTENTEGTDPSESAQA